MSVVTAETFTAAADGDAAALKPAAPPSTGRNGSRCLWESRYTPVAWS